MARNNRRFGPADRAVVITALLAGATVAAAAKAAGYAVQTLYDDRKRCPLFARAWSDAVAESGRPRLVERGTGGWWQLKRLRRNRFTRARKDLFLGQLAVCADVHASALAAGVCTSTVYSHRESDPAFAAAWRSALACGVAVMEGLLLQQRLQALEDFDVEPADLPPAGPGNDKAAANPVERDLEFWRCLHLLREHRRVEGAGAGGHIRGRGVRPRIRSNAEVKAELRRALEVFGERVRREQGREAPPDAAERGDRVSAGFTDRPESKA
jgi:hypothetical protein